jgi:pyridoxamine-phosphate oxidase
MQENDKVSLLFWWAERQVRIEGVVNKVDKETAEKYFHSRPKGSQIGAVVSPQSQVIESRFVLEDKFKEAEHSYKGKEVPFPDHWGGYIVTPHLIEFWQGRVSRLHDRIQYTLIEEDNWKMERLAP